MPAFRFKCECGNEFLKLLKTRQETHVCVCGKFGQVQFADSAGTVVMETRDAHRGKAVRKNIERTIQERSRDHHNRYEIEEKVDRHGLDDAVKFGWDKKIKRI